MIDALLLTAVRIMTFQKKLALTNASGFFFSTGSRLFLVTSRHVLIDAPCNHYPDRIEIELHVARENMAASTGFSIPLYRRGRSIWRQGQDATSEVDVAVIEIDQSALPASTVYQAFTPAHIAISTNQRVRIGSSLLIVGFPLGFHDALHHLPIARHAINASTFGMRFNGNGYFLTDGRTHRGTSGAPVVVAIAEPTAATRSLPWALLGIHSASLDTDSRDLRLDEALGLNSAWYADILLKLTS
jgi:S1-C subfamily serine protease